MNQSMPAWAALVSPAASLLGTMLIVMMGVYLQNRAVDRGVELLRAEFGQKLAEMELRLTKQLLELIHRVERLEEARGLIRSS